ncbi:MAG: phosphatase PAP2 family protein [Lentisphaerae bacterium]|jgi:undecaprenyl-diphosphatase|nr:phosphatase PAP2 family protein [Lentisphaerota bacterium]
MNELGLNCLRWVQEIRTPEGEAFFLRVTEWGEGFWLMAILGVVFWVWGGRVAYRAGLALMVGELFGSVLKNIFKIPRAWVRDETLLPVEGARWGAFGYSFPSGHATGSALLGGGIAVASRRWWLWLPALLWMGLVGISRVYLGVHTPVDVAGGWLLAAVVVGLAVWAVNWMEAEDWRSWAVMGGAVLLALAGIWLIRRQPLPEGASWFDHGRDTYRAGVALLAFVASWHIERTRIRYQPERLGAFRILAVVVGVVVLALMARHLRRLLAFWLGPHGAMYVQAAAGPLWIFVVWPYFLKGLEKPEAR